jgi:cytochrome c-type biogenesis protein CcmF
MLLTSIISFKYPEKNSGRIRYIYILWSMAVLLVFLPTSLLVYYQVTGNYSFVYVYEHTQKALPAFYKISALWSGQQGSFLLWACILAVFGFFVIGYSSKTTGRLLGIYSIISFLITMPALLTDAFKTMPEAPDGLGLTAALQDPWMVLHPPLVFVGYTSMAVLFALFPNVASQQQLVKKWLRLSFIFLGLGILTGSVWAYRALGWGGFWAWDAIENIALVPWLIMCAYLHGKLRYTKLICVLPFIIAVLGTFLTRSGVLQGKSAHSYTSSGSNPALAILIIFLTILVIGIVVMIRLRIIRLNVININDKMQVFRVATYLYAAIILVITLIQIISSLNVPVSLYNLVTSIYATAVCALLLWYNQRLPKAKYILVLIFNTVITFVMLILFAGIKLPILILFWVCLLPVTFFFLNIRSSLKSRYLISHLFVGILILGVVSASGFSNQFVDIVNIKDNSIIVQNKVFSSPQIKAHKTLIIHKLSGDFIINNIKIINDGIGNAVVTYSSKPMIYLFWIGSFGLIGYCFYSLI